MKQAGRIGSVAMAMAVMAVLVMSCCNMQVANAQVSSCLHVSGGAAPFNDAATVIQELRVKAGQCCQSNSGGFCTVLLTSGNASATICGPVNYCPTCVDVGNSLNVVLSQCNVQNTVQGVYSPDGSSLQLFYITSASTHP